MNRYWAHMHVGHSIEFVGDSWEEGGFRVDDAGNPVRDPRGNTVAGWDTREVSAEDASLLAQAYAGDNAIEDRDAFLGWLSGEGGMTADGAVAVAKELGLN
jgi:hypothetical protein